jgi:glycosyltransferase involved in cell wall biosynthesis
LELFPQADPSRITNTYQSVSVSPPDQVVAVDELDNWLDRLFDLKRDGYFLYFGALEPKKNLGRLIEAYLNNGHDVPLVIVGSRGWRSEGELRLLNGAHGTTLKGLARIRRLDYLPRALLISLIRGARAVVFPSLYEGFGLPVLEAMSLGVPVLTANTSSLPEVAGDAALMTDPYDVSAIAVALRKLDGNAALRQSLAVAGPKQATKFGPDAYAERLSAVYARFHP